MKMEYDVIIVGAGSAGCALAYRLAAESDLQVLLLEAGSPARNPMIHMPLGFAFLLKAHSNNWNYKTRPEPFLNNRHVDLPRGKVLGGCSAINGMVYVRGQAEDYDRWAELGNEGWAYSDVLPFFKKSEDNENGADEFHGKGGPLWVGNVVDEFPVNKAFIEAAKEAGHPFNPDINGATQEGVGYFPHNIYRGKRLSSAAAFLDHKTGAAHKPDNLLVVPFAHTRRVVIENGRAVAVECEVKGKKQLFKAGKEIVLSAGAINSPKILELSGIGQAEHLQKLGIAVVHDLPGVGENLHDHWNAYLKQSIRNGDSYFSESKPLPMLKNLFRYFFRKKGFLANPAALVAVFFRALESAERPDSQIHFAPAASNFDAKGNMVPIEGITIATCGVRPDSRGSTHIASARFEDAPDIQVNYLQTERDRKIAIAAFRQSRQIAAASALKGFCGEEMEPGSHVQSDEEILEYIRQTGDPVHHLAGSCKMGVDDLAVVDNRLCVYGIEGLRVADASIMPEIVSGNTHAPCVMIAEKAAEMMLEKYRA
ncbi:MAG: GMC family oxidoreductase N-terminal domain-containing protein [Pseudomonadales bacterium]|nr:GMC family oxidoreductase N-terminal domain-containing protein [Pseudomonadales bacterium]